MKHQNINRWVFEIPLEDVQNDDVYNVTNECLLCGKKIKKEAYSVHLLTSGKLVSTDQPFGEDEDMGFYPIGSDCKNRLPNNFYFKVDKNEQQ